MVAAAAAACLTVVFVLAIAHKVDRLGRRRVMDDEVIASFHLAHRLAKVAFTIALVVEIALVVALWTYPVAGLVAAAPLLLAYAAVLGRLDADTSCACFGALSTASARQGQKRNIVLALMALAGAGALIAGEDFRLNAEAVALAVVPLAAAAALEIVGRFQPPATGIQEP